MDAVKRLRESWDASTCYSAASNGHIECLRYAHENGCPWDEQTCSDAVSNGHMDCAQYARDNGCPISRECADAIKRYEDAVTFLGVGVALSHRQEGGRVSLRAFLPLYLEYQRYHRSR